MIKVDYFICHRCCQVSRLQQTHIEDLLLRSHRCLSFCSSINADRVTRHSSVNLVLALFKERVYASIAYPVSIRLSSGVNDFVHWFNARQWGV